MWWLRASSPTRWSLRTWSSRAPCLALLSGTSSTKTLGEQSTRPVLRKLSTRKIWNGFKEFAHKASVVSVLAEAKKCQTEPHKVGRANQVSFDPAKESVHIVSHAQPYGDPFKLLGICFDCKLWMDLVERDVVSQASWKLTTILRTRRFHGVSQLVQVYKSKVLSFVEYRTPAVNHVAKTTLAGIDAVQRRFLRECGLSDEDALLHFNLVPLETPRNIAMLGLIHRSVLGCGPRHFANMFFALSAVGFSETRQTNFYHTGALANCKFCHALHWDSLMSTICQPLRWLARRLWPQCSTNCRRF